MKRKIYIPIFRLIFIIVLIFQFSSCQNMGHQNFQKRKYLKLKNLPEVDEQVQTGVPQEDEISEINTPLDEEASITYSEPILDDVVDHEFVEKPQEGLDLKNNTNKSIPHREIKTVKKERYDFNKLSKESQNREIIKFNKNFNEGLAILLFGFLFLGLAIAILIGSNALEILGFITLGIALFCIFVAWIISMIATHRVSKLRAAGLKNDRLSTKVSLARLMAVIGILVCIVTITPGIILLILYAAKVI